MLTQNYEFLALHWDGNDMHTYIAIESRDEKSDKREMPARTHLRPQQVAHARGCGGAGGGRKRQGAAPGEPGNSSGTNGQHDHPTGAIYGKISEKRRANHKRPEGTQNQNRASAGQQIERKRKEETDQIADGMRRG